MFQETIITPQSKPYSLLHGLGNRPVCDGASLISNNMERIVNGKKLFSKTHGLSGTRLFWVFFSMKDRCLNENSPQYDDYGGRGISVCDEWTSNPVLFFDWAKTSGYRSGLHINRINNDGPYSPTNCKWSTRQENNENKRPYKNNKSGYPNIEWRDATNSWRVRIRIHGHTHNVGHYKQIEDAIVAYNNYVTSNNINRKLHEIRTN